MVSFEINGVKYHTVGGSYRNGPYVRITTDKPKSPAQLLSMADFTRSSIEALGKERADDIVKDKMSGKTYRSPPTREEVIEELRVMKAKMVLSFIDSF